MSNLWYEALLQQAEKERDAALAALRELLDSQPWSTGLEAYRFDREEAAWDKARALLGRQS